MRSVLRVVTFSAAGLAALAGRAEASVIANFEAMLVHPTVGGSRLFGLSVAVDGETAVVGVPNDGGSMGSVQVFVRAGGSWTHQAWLTHPAAASGDGFGSRVAIHGDTVVVAVVGDDTPSATGSVQVYVRNGTTWSHQAQILPPANALNTFFGTAVAVHGDTALVGAPWDPVAGPDPVTGASSADGSVHVYVRNGSTWTYLRKVTDPAVATDPASARGAEFGSAIAMDGATAVIGALRDKTRGSGAGAAHVFATSSWSHLPKLTAPDGAAFDGFGASVAVAGERVLVGAVFDDTAAGPDAGSAHVFLNGVHEAMLVHPAGAAGDEFGNSVAISGDVALVGAPRDDIAEAFGGPDGGSAHLYLRSGGAWTAQVELRHPFDVGGLSGDQFGRWVALDGQTCVVGAPFDNNPNGSDAGAAFANGLVLPPTDPVAEAGPDQTAGEGVAVTLDGSASTDPNGDPLAFHWEQIAGPTVTLSDPNAAEPTFTAPSVSSGGATLTFRLTVDDGTHTSPPDNVDVTVNNVNTFPVADAGDDQTAQEGSPVTLHGGDSYDPDSEPLTYLWIQTAGPAVSLSSPTAADPLFVAPLVGAAGETLVFSLTVTDGIDLSTDEVLVALTNVNQVPAAHAGLDQTIAEGKTVMLDGTASDDPDADPLSYAWSQQSGPPVTLSYPASAMPTFAAPVVGPGGSALVFQLVVSDSAATSEPDNVTITVLDTNQPPACDLARPSLGLLWPPNHKLAPIGIEGVSDPQDEDVQITITAVTQDEAVNGLGDGDTSPDGVLQGSSVLIRSERAGSGTGRVYEVVFIAEDPSGAACTGSVAVCVPHDRRTDDCLDEGQAYDSLLP